MNSAWNVACLVLCAISAVSSGKFSLSDERGLMDFMLQSRDVSQQNPQRSLECFNYYVPVLNGITAEYETSYGACLTSAELSRETIDDSTQPERDEIEGSAEATCEALKTCNGYNDSLDYFGCYIDKSSDSLKTMHTISANAAEILANVREQYHLIETQQYRCTNACERTYVENTSSTYEELQRCLMGLSSVPTTAAPSTTTAEQSTTEETTTTEEITTTTGETTTTEEIKTTTEETTTTEEITTTTEKTTTVEEITNTTGETTTTEENTTSNGETTTSEEITTRTGETTTAEKSTTTTGETTTTEEITTTTGETTTNEVTATSGAAGFFPPGAH